MAELAAGELREKRLHKAKAERGQPEPISLYERVVLLRATAEAPATPHDVRERILGTLDKIGVIQGAALEHAWKFRARPTQLAPSDPHWIIWLILSGRGWGKTRTGAEWVFGRIEDGTARSIGLIGPTLKDVWDTMVYGSADAPGLVRLYDHLPAHMQPDVKRNDRKIHFPGGASASIYTAEEAELRGPNMDTIWCDELAKWRYLRTLWDNIEMTLRVKGKTPPRICVTTTPRPLALIKELLDDPDVRLTVGSTFANSSNLARSYQKRLMKRYGNSRLGLQELFGGLLDDNPDALWQQGIIEAGRVDTPPTMARVVIAVDPAVSENKRSDLTGIVVVGLGADGDVYVLDDLTGVILDASKPGLVYERLEEPHKHTPNEWGDIVIRAYTHYKADAIVGERNKIGSLVASNVRAAMYRKAHRDGQNPDLASAALKIRTPLATRGKDIRAEPVVTLYEQGRVHHLGHLVALEQEQTEWNPKVTPVSPNRIDALVHGVTEVSGIAEEEGHDHREGFRGLEEANAAIVPTRWDALLPPDDGGGRYL